MNDNLYMRFFQDGFAALQDHGDQLVVVVRSFLRLFQRVFRDDARHGEN